MTNKNNIKGMWIGIKELITLKHTKSNIPIALEVGRLKVTDKHSISTAFNNYFTSIGSNLANAIPVINTPIQAYMSNPLCNSFALFQVTISEVVEEINNLNSSKSVGPSSIPTKLLKIVKFLVAGPLAYIFNCSFSLGIVPSNCPN